MELIDKDAIVAEIEKKKIPFKRDIEDGYYPTYLCALMDFEDFINTLEVINPYEEHIQYDSIKSGIQRHAETYSFNIDSKLFPQLTKEQQELWKKEIEQAVISGGEAGVELAKDIRYKENLEVKEVDLEKEINNWIEDNTCRGYCSASISDTAEYFFELGLKAQKGE